MDKVPSWDEYFMNCAVIARTRSKDPNTKVGSVIVKDNKQISAGYNGMPSGMEETQELWSKPIKYDFVVHSEANALLNATQDVKGATLYVTLSPCKECAKLIAASGIKRVVYMNEYTTVDEVARKIFAMCGISLEKLTTQ